MLTRTTQNRLPDEAYVELTEAFTWTLDGRSRTDEDINKERALIQLENQVKWWCNDGPAWLLPCVDELLHLPDANVKPIGACGIDSARLLRAQKWLDGSGLGIDAARLQIRAHIDAAWQRWNRLQRLQKVAFNGCAEQRRVIMAILFGAQKHEYREIPRVYYLQPTYHFMGWHYHGNGQVGRDYLSAREHFASMMSNREPPAIYLRAKISRAHALELRDEFVEAEAVGQNFGRSVFSAETMRRGPKSKKRVAVVEAMRSLDPEWLRRLPDKMLEYEFRGLARRTTIKQARKEVLDEVDGQPDSQRKLRQEN
jgi:aryl carrier-like protein